MATDWLFPPRCVGCGKVGARFCAQCMAAAPRLNPPLCVRCGQELDPPAADGLCPRCRRRPPAFFAARAWAHMEGSVQRAVHRLKYRRDLGLGEALARPLLALAEETGWAIESVLPVPLSPSRRRQRGYNQAALLAYPVALGLGVPYLGKALIRARETRSQVGLSVAERWANVAGAFHTVQPEAIAGKTLLLIDDVMTTGATLDAAAQALLAAGARQVFALTVARALLHWKHLGDLEPFSLKQPADGRERLQIDADLRASKR